MFGHTLDLLITRSEECFVRNISVVHNFNISDHLAILAILDLSSLKHDTADVIYPRSFRDFPLETFKQELHISLVSHDDDSDIDISMGNYNKTLGKLLDQYVPSRRRKLGSHPPAPWLSEEIVEERET